MKERGMIFNGEMVRAILDGRKTQTRRIVSPQPELTARSGFAWKGSIYGAGSSCRETNENFAHVACPLGNVGDRIWVRETWGNVSYEFGDDNCMVDYVPDRPAKEVHEKPFGNGYYSGYVIYAADGGNTWCDDDGCVDGRSCWKPSIHMPRWASRITLEITGVRVERLNDISESDAISEGVEPATYQVTPPDAVYRVGFSDLWRSIYGDDGWKSNPWVWVVEFREAK